MATQENVAAARYVSDMYPNLKVFSGINPNYAWGQDAWSDFTESLKQLKPQAQIATNVTPKLGAGQYNTEISALLTSNAEIMQNSLWGGDLEAYILQAAPRGLLKKSPNVIICGDTILDPGEGCDDGPANADDAACTAQCQLARCGDGLVQAGVEACDDGNQDDSDSCVSGCLAAACGDGFLGPGEACDDGNQIDDDDCTNACATASCGDAKLQAPEECDDGNVEYMVQFGACCSNSIFYVS